MGRKRIRIDYTVYERGFQPGVPNVCSDFRTLMKAKSAARGLGPGSRIYRNFNLESKRSKPPHDWWSSRFYWTWEGQTFLRKIEASIH
jgi:hypothetical protein